LRRFFQKATGVRGDAPLFSVFWFFFAPTCTKKNGEDFLIVTRPNPFPAFFFDISSAKKKAWQRRNAELVSLVATSDEGFAPSTCGRFLKKATQKLLLVRSSAW